MDASTREKGGKKMNRYYYLPNKVWAGCPPVIIFYPDGDLLCIVHGNPDMNIDAKEIADKILYTLNKKLEEEEARK